MNDVSAAKPLPHRTCPRQFHNLHEFVAVARARLDRNVWDYLIGGAETETTVRRNRLALDSLAFRPRVLRDVNGTDTGDDVPRPQDRNARGAGADRQHRAVRPRRLAAVADAAGTFGCPMFQSSVAKPEIEETGKVVPNGLKISSFTCAATRPGSRRLRPRGQGRLRRALPHGRHHHYSRRERDISKRYHAASSRNPTHRAIQKALDWAQVDKSKRSTSCRIVIKGIATAEDAKLAVEHGVDVIYVSNHGGRQLDHGAGAIDMLPEIVAAAQGQGHHHHRWQLLPRHRRGEGDRARRRPGLRRPPLCLRHGSGGPRRHLPRAGAATGRDDPRHGPARRQPIASSIHPICAPRRRSGHRMC